MRQSFKLLSTSSLLLMTLWSAGCATTTINSGLQAGDLPPVGDFTAENGLQFNIQPLNLATLPPPQVSRPTNDIYQLIASSKKKEYRISQGDILAINLVGYPDMNIASSGNSNSPASAGYPVDQQGFVQFPLVGRVKAAGLSVPQFTASLQSQLQRYLKYSDPQVKIINYRGNKFFIDGEVRQPGEFNIADAPVSLYGAISMAGGATPEGDSNNVVLMRRGTRYELGLRDLQNMGLSANQIYLQDGDSIHINRLDRNQVYVLGEFGEIKPLEIPDHGITLTQVIGQSKGLNPSTANAAKIYVVRDHGSASYTDIYYVNLQTVTNLALANRFEMHPNDIVYVDPTGLTRWNRFINSILPSSNAIRQLSGL